MESEDVIIFEWTSVKMNLFRFVALPLSEIIMLKIFAMKLRKNLFHKFLFEYLVVIMLFQFKLHKYIMPKLILLIWHCCYSWIPSHLCSLFTFSEVENCRVKFVVWYSPFRSVVTYNESLFMEQLICRILERIIGVGRRYWDQTFLADWEDTATRMQNKHIKRKVT